MLKLIYEDLVWIRNSYVLWENANKTWRDKNTNDVFNSGLVVEMQEEELRNKLIKYKLALQPNKQTAIWKTLCNTIECKLDGDLRNLFRMNDFYVERIKSYILSNKKDFPYLGGNKIMNYWLYVMEQYNDVKFADRVNITIAPDTHVIQSSEMLGVISKEEKESSKVQEITVERWKEILEGTELVPIDIHTPMWLWSRGKFQIKL